VRLSRLETVGNFSNADLREMRETPGTKGQNGAKTAFSTPRPEGVKIDEKA